VKKRITNLKPATAIPEIFKEKTVCRRANVGQTGSFVPSYAPPDHATGLRATRRVLDGRRSGSAIERGHRETGGCGGGAVVNVADVGHRRSTEIVETQALGAAIMQLGFTLFEKLC